MAAVAVDNLIVQNRLQTSTQTGGTLTLEGTGSRQPAVEKALLVQGGGTIAGVLTVGTLDVTANATVYGLVTADGGFGAVHTAAVTLNGILTCAAVNTALFALQFYVAPGGSDVTGNGTITSPFSSVGAAVAAAEADPDNTAPRCIVLQPGTYTENVLIQSCLAVVGNGDVAIEGNVRIFIAPGATPPGIISLHGIRIEGRIRDSPLGLVSGDHTLVLSGCTVNSRSTFAAAVLVNPGEAAVTCYITNCALTTVATGTYLVPALHVYGTRTSAILTGSTFTVNTTVATVKIDVLRLGCDVRMEGCTLALTANVDGLEATLCRVFSTGRALSVRDCTFTFTALDSSVSPAFLTAVSYDETDAYFIRNLFSSNGVGGQAVTNGATGTAYTQGNVSLPGSFTGFAYATTNLAVL